MRASIGSLFAIVPFRLPPRCSCPGQRRRAWMMTTPPPPPAILRHWMAGLLDAFSPRTRGRVLAPVPYARRVWALPFVTVLAPSARFHQERGTRHKTLLDWGRQALLQLRRWLPGRRIVAVTDTGFAALELLGAVRRRVDVITRL